MYPARESSNICFAEFEFDLRNEELRGNGTRLRLPAQSLQILNLLLQKPGHLVTRDELRERLWTGDTFVDFDHGLNVAINRLREALGDSATQPRFIETLPRRGYRFIGILKGLPDRRRRRRIPLAVYLAVAATSAFVVVGVVLSSQSPGGPKLVGSRQVTNDGIPKIESLCCGALANDATRIYFSELADSEFSVAQVPIVGGEVTRIPSSISNLNVLGISANHSDLLVSHDENSSLESSLWSLPVAGGSVTRLGDAQGTDASWSSNGDSLLLSRGPEIYIAGRFVENVRRVGTAGGIVIRPRLSPDGRLIRFTQINPATQRGSLWEIPLAGGEARPVFARENDGRNECCGEWTADGKYFIFQTTRNGVANIAVVRDHAGPISDAPTLLTSGPINYLSPSLSMDGKTLFVIGSQQRGELVRFDRKSQRYTSYLGGISAEGLDFSPDGQWVTYAEYPSGRLWKSRSDGTQRLALTDSSMRAGLPRWSPDGKQIAFAGSHSEGSWRIYVVPAAGGKAEQLIPGDDSQLDPSWSPDGRRIAFGDSLWVRRSAIHIFDRSSGQITTLSSSEDMFSPRWSPDGNFVATLTRDSRHLLLFDLKTQKWIPLINDHFVAYPSWSRDGRWIYFCSSREPSRTFYRVRVADGTLEPVAAANLTRGLAWGLFGWWSGMTPEGDPLLLRDTSIQEIYALQLQWD